MKRSEAISRLSSFLCDQDESSVYSPFHKRAEEILEFFEKEIGMQPPIKMVQKDIAENSWETPEEAEFQRMCDLRIKVLQNFCDAWTEDLEAKEAREREFQSKKDSCI